MKGGLGLIPSKQSTACSERCEISVAIDMNQDFTVGAP
jgi:hypothetical protein